MSIHRKTLDHGNGRNESPQRSVTPPKALNGEGAVPSQHQVHSPLNHNHHHQPGRLLAAKVSIAFLGGATALLVWLIVGSIGLDASLSSPLSLLYGSSGAGSSEGEEVELTTSDEERVKEAFDMSMYTWTTVEPFEGFNVDIEMKDSLELLRDVPVVSDYTRELRIRPTHRADENGTEPVKVACLYAGFIRDFEKMYMTCGDNKHTHPRFCAHPKRRKFYGQQRKNLIASLDCDIFMSTWNIRGAGRFNTFKYDMNATMWPPHVIGIYGYRLARLHMQNYSAYQPLWEWMAPFKRFFPQTHPTVTGHDARGFANWTGIPDQNPFIRINDYSQSYKQWCVLQLVNRYSLHYDLYFRLRTDLRSTHQFSNIKFATGNEDPDMLRDLSHVPKALFDNWSKESKRLYATGSFPPVRFPEGPPLATDPPLEFQYNRSRAIMFQLKKVERKEARFGVGKNGKPIKRRGTPAPAVMDDSEDGGSSRGPSKGPVVIPTTNHSVGEGRIHINDFGVGDFGFLATPGMVTELGKLWHYCTRYSNKRADHVEHVHISEYNLMLWYIVFTNEWQVDSGGRYLWVSRRGALFNKKLQGIGGGTTNRGVKGPMQVLKVGAGTKVISRKVKRKM